MWVLASSVAIIGPLRCIRGAYAIFKRPMGCGPPARPSETRRTLMIKASEYAECSYCIGRFAAGLVTPDQFKTGERIALDIVLPKLDNDADAVAEAVKNKGRRSHGTSARSNAVTEIKTAIVKKSRTLSCSPEL